MYVKDQKSWKLKLLYSNHHSLFEEHSSETRTLNLITCRSHWPNIQKFVKKYTSLFNICQRSKLSWYKQYWKLPSFFFLDKPWYNMIMDFIIDLQLSKKQKYYFVLVIIFWLIKIPYFILCHKTVIAIKLANLFFKKIVCLHGLLESIVSDCSFTFTFQF